MAKSTTKSVGSSARTTLYFFLNCAFLFLAPFLICCFALEIASYGFSLPVPYIVASCLPVSATDLAGLVASLYFYWTLFCVYSGVFHYPSLSMLDVTLVVYLKCPHALNIVKYQTFKIPWRFRRDHVSHMRLDRLRRACQTTSSDRSSTKKVSSSPSLDALTFKNVKAPKKLFTIFVNIPTAGTIALSMYTSFFVMIDSEYTPAVASATTVSDLRHGICQLSHSHCYNQEPIYHLGR